MKKFLKHLAVYSVGLSLLLCAGCNTGTGNGNGEIPEEPDYDGATVGDLLNEKYTVSTTATGGGTVTASVAEVQFGGSVTFTFAANDGCVLARFTINGNEVDVDGNSYTVSGVMRNYNVKAEFVNANVTIKFAGDDIGEIEDKPAVFGQAFGTLPTPKIPAGKRFVGWKDESGAIVTADTLIKSAAQTITLTAVWEDVELDHLSLYQPFSITTAYYDAAATKYGVVWHTKTVPANPVVLVSEGDDVDEATARVIDAKAELWFKTEYVVQAVVDELDFDTTYTVKLGDASADVWSDEYTFTTRKEVVDNANFFYISDTQETVRIQDTTNINGIEGSLGDTYVSQVMREATERFPDADFIAHGGDIVNWGAESIAWEEMLGSLDEYLFNLPMMPVSGNHEDPMWYGFGRNVPHILDAMFNIDGVKDEHASAGIYYSFDYGPMHFIGLRTNDVYNDYGAGLMSEKQLAWLVSDLEKANANTATKWNVVMMHEGPINPKFEGKTSSNTHTPTLAKQMVPLFDKNNVDLVLFGHDHWMMNTYPLVVDNTAESLPYIPDVKVKPSTTKTESVQHDGVNVAKFDFTGVTKRGTVYHEASTAGHQLHGDYFPYASVPSLLESLKIYQALASNGKGGLDPATGADANKVYPSYSYIEVSGDKLVLRNYGVDVASVVKETENLTNHGVYIGGFMLTK